MPVSDSTAKRIEEIQFLIASGKTMQEVAVELGYADVKSFYRYVYRHNMKWNPAKNNYDALGKDGKPIEAVKLTADNPAGKVQSIISMFQRGIDGRDIAKKLRFSSYQEMADYMRSKGHLWNDRISNYEKNPREIKPEVEEKTQDEVKQQPKTKHETKVSGKYDEMLEQLFNHYEEIMSHISSEKEINTVPRYLLSGVMTIKSVNMINTLDILIKEYSDEFNITQKEIFEVALIEFLKKYGFKDRVKAYLKV